MNNLVRCFISLEISEDARQEIVGLQKRFKKEKLFKGKFTNKDDLQLTIKFLGEIDRIKLEEIKKRLSKISYNVLNLKLGRAGFFGYDLKKIWIGVQGDGLKELYNLIEDNIWDILPSQRRFSAHITFAKVDSIKYPMILKKTINELEVGSVEFDVDKFYLKESKVVNKESMYLVLEDYSLE